eukprot:GHRQ01000799.1.p1 GENE.GHRQ01000799.1~~GHRQ01000799.1.p1  ORF type:complete len:347 (+),score=127.10 GHRQ01000799.1:165-1205(+)
MLAMSPALMQFSSSHACGSLQFQFDADEPQQKQHQTEAARLDALQDRLRWLQEPQSTFQLQLQRDVRRLMRVMGREKLDVVVMASRLSLVGYHVTVRTAIGGGPSCFRNLRHEFLTVLAHEGDFKDSTLIVDPLFREQFAIPQPTATYQALLKLIPAEFVGTASRLIPIVQCLCAEMVASFESKGLTLPPWRRVQSMLSKWLPTKSRDVAFGGSSSNGSLSHCSSTAAAGVAGTSCESDSGSLELATAGGSPFSRISDVDVADRVVRLSSSRSLLSGKLSSSAATRAGCSGATCSSRMGAASSGAAANQAVGTVSMQPPVYRGQPATYKVKMASAAALLQQLPRRQ